MQPGIQGMSPMPGKAVRRFDAAPFSLSLKVISGVATAFLLAIALVAPRAVVHRGAEAMARAITAVLILGPPLMIGGALLFVVRGYELQPGMLHVRRLFWTTRIPLAGFQRAWHDPQAMRRSTRLFGNSGLFSITGVFRNKPLGTYRAFVTNPGQAVVIRLASRVVVVSPAEPRAFIAALESRDGGP
jgi:hypothetical protein